MTTSPAPETDGGPLSLGTEAARNLATTTKTVPQMQGISSRWLLRVLPWVNVSGGTYRVNRRLTYVLGDGRLTFINEGDDIRVVPNELRELGVLSSYEDGEVLNQLAAACTRRDVEAGQVIVEAGTPVTDVYLIVHGRVRRTGTGPYGETTTLPVLADAEFFGDRTLTEESPQWDFTAVADTAVILLLLPRSAFEEVLGRSPSLQAQLDQVRATEDAATNRAGEAAIELTSGHEGEPVLPGTFVDYELNPREYPLSVAQTVLRVHTRVADLYNDPMNQVEQQLRLTIEALRERQEFEMVNNRSFGLLNNTDFRQRLRTRTGPPTPDDLDELLTRRRSTKLFLAHPRAIAAFNRECTRRGIYPNMIDVDGASMPGWRGVPIFPCNKIPISPTGTTTIMAMRTGEKDQGVVGLYQIGIPDEFEPGLNVRFMGISEQAIMSYLVSTYYSAAILVPDALGVLEDVQVSFYGD